MPRSHTHVFSNFVTTLDGVISLNTKGHASGGVDLSLPVFVSGNVQALIVTTTAGAKRLLKQTVPDSVDIRAIRPSASEISASAILDEVSLVSAGKLILVEGRPRLLGDFYAERLVDEQFLTLAPQIAGRDAGDGRLSLTMGKAFAPRNALWETLIDVRRGGSHLYLRCTFPAARSGQRIRCT